MKKFTQVLAVSAVSITAMLLGLQIFDFSSATNNANKPAIGLSAQQQNTLTNIDPQDIEVTPQLPLPETTALIAQTPTPRSPKFKHTDEDVNHETKGGNETGSRMANSTPAQSLPIDPPENYDPEVSKQRKAKLLADLSEEVKFYDYNERFDLNAFLSDERLHQLDAEQGDKLIAYVFNRLQGIPLMQAQADAVKLLTEQNP